jgi:hypothetical protein
VGTNTQQLLVWGGWQWPLTDDVLVAAAPAVFALPALHQADAVQLGVTAHHVVVRAGALTVYLARAVGRYPDVPRAWPEPAAGAPAVVVPARHLPRVVEQLTRWPGRPATVTLEVGPGLRLGADSAAGATAWSCRTWTAVGRCRAWGWRGTFCCGPRVVLRGAACTCVTVPRPAVALPPDAPVVPLPWDERPPRPCPRPYRRHPRPVGGRRGDRTWRG